MPSTKCSQCGQSADDKADVCSQCGAKLSASPAAPLTAGLATKRSPKSLIGITLTVLIFAIGLVTFLWQQQQNGSVAEIPPAPLPKLQETKVKAEMGDRQAEGILGEIYAEGKQVRQDYAEAAKWYRKAADQGLAKAQYNLGVLYDVGQGVPKDESEAAKWYRKAGDQGDANAQYTLAGMYSLGRGVVADTKEALSWYQKAAEQGDVLAQYNLAERYERGKTVPQDPVEAYKWHSLAAQEGLKDAAVARDNLGRNMTSEQHAESRKRVEQFKAKYSRPKQP